MQQYEWHFYDSSFSINANFIAFTCIFLIFFGLTIHVYLFLLAVLASFLIGLTLINADYRQHTSQEFIRCGTKGFSFQINPDPQTYHIPYAALLYAPLEYQRTNAGHRSDRMVNVKLHLEYRLPEDDPDSEPRTHTLDLSRVQYPPAGLPGLLGLEVHPYDQTVQTIYQTILANCSENQLASYSPTQAMRDKAWLEREKQRTREWLDSFKKPY